MLNDAKSLAELAGQTDDHLAIALQYLREVNAGGQDLGIEQIVEAAGALAGQGRADADRKSGWNAAATADNRLSALRRNSIISILGFLYEELDDGRAHLASVKMAESEDPVAREHAIDQISDVLNDIIAVMTRTPCTTKSDVATKAKLMKYFIADSEPDLTTLLTKSLCDDVLNSAGK